MVDVYSTEPERRAALEEVTALRRQFDTTTGKGAAAFAKDPAAQAALARLDAAKSAAGMRTAAQDLAALNRIDTQFTAQGKTQEEVTQRLNVKPEQYFKKVYATVNDITRVPPIEPRLKTSDGKLTNKVPQEVIEENKRYGWDYSNARLGWVLTGSEGEQKWAIGLIGGQRIAPKTSITTLELAKDQWMSDTETLGEVTSKYIPNLTRNQGWQQGVGGVTPTGSQVTLDELAQAIPEIKYSQFQEIIYQLTLEKDEDITIEDILDKYDKMFGKG
jgi:Skp family chaperone for outer membrane proteins